MYMVWGETKTSPYCYCTGGTCTCRCVDENTSDLDQSKQHKGGIVIQGGGWVKQSTTKRGVHIFEKKLFTAEHLTRHLS